jgi:hypothetical protein
MTSSGFVNCDEVPISSRTLGKLRTEWPWGVHGCRPFSKAGERSFVARGSSPAYKSGKASVLRVFQLGRMTEVG